MQMFHNRRFWRRLRRLSRAACGPISRDDMAPGFTLVDAAVCRLATHCALR
jgi:hypothetical protein